MANLNVQRHLQRIARELAAIDHHVRQKSGVPRDQAMDIDNLATQAADISAGIASLAREELGDRSAPRLVTNVRKALGFTFARVGRR